MGISVKGKVAGEEACDLGIHIKSIIKGGAAAKVGKYDDQHILSLCLSVSLSLCLSISLSAYFLCKQSCNVGAFVQMFVMYTVASCVCFVLPLFICHKLRVLYTIFNKQFIHIELGEKLFYWRRRFQSQRGDKAVLLVPATTS